MTNIFVRYVADPLTVVVYDAGSAMSVQVHTKDEPYLSDPAGQNGNILKVLNGALQYVTPGTMLTMNFWKGTEVEYNALPAEQKEDPSIIHFII